MNILFISQLIPARADKSGSSYALLEFLEQWSSEVQLQVYRPVFRYEKINPPGEGKLDFGSVLVNYIKPFRIPLLKTTWYPWRKLLKSLDEKPDVIICHLYNSYYPFRKLAQKAGIPFIIGVHNSDIRFAGNWFHKGLQKQALKRCHGLACRSHALMDRFSRIYPQYSKLCFPALSGLPQQYIDYALGAKHKLPGNNKKGLNIISVAKLIPLKNIHQVIIALATLKQHPWTYTIVGDGPMQRELEELGKEMGVEERLHFTGRLSREETFDLLKSSELFVLPSYPETLGLAYLEALAAGNVVLGTRGWGVDGIIENNRSGYLVEPGNDESLKSTLEQIMLSTPEQLGAVQKAGLEIISKMDQATMAETYLESIRQVLADHPSRD